MLLSIESVIELEVKDTIDTARSTSHLGIHLYIDSEGPLRTEIYDKRDDFYLYICICYNITTTPPCGIHISQLIRFPEPVGSIMTYLIEGYYW